MTRVVVHRAVVSTDLRALRKTDKSAAAAAVDLIRKLESTSLRGRKLDQPSWRAYDVEPGVAVIAAGVGTGTVRILGVGPLPTVYDTERLESMAGSAIDADMKNPLEPGVPPPAQRSRLVHLAEAESTASYRSV